MLQEHHFHVDVASIEDPAGLLAAIDEYLAATRPRVWHARKKPLWRKLQKLATSVEPTFQRALVTAAAKTVRASDRKKIAAAIKRDDIDGAVESVPWDSIGEDVIKSDVLKPFGKTLIRAGELTIDTLPTLSAADFSIDNPRMIQWVRDHGAELVVQIGRQQRLALRAAVESVLVDGLAPDAAADHLMQFVGLHEKWAGAVIRYRGELLELGDPDAIAKADLYASRLRRARGAMIARTEAQYAVQNGRVEAWDQAIERDVLDPERDKQQWMTSENEAVCPEICEPMNQQTVKLSENFTTGKGDSIRTSPAHVNCACDVVLIRDGERVE